MMSFGAGPRRHQVPSFGLLLLSTMLHYEKLPGMTEATVSVTFTLSRKWLQFRSWLLYIPLRTNKSKQAEDYPGGYLERGRAHKEPRVSGREGWSLAAAEIPTM